MYKLFDAKGNEIELENLQYRPHWYEHGESLENAFVNHYGKKLGVIINPEKNKDPTVPDLKHDNGLGDLKSQHTPLFTSLANYNIPPTYAVTFNLKDVFAYGVNGGNYKNFKIYYGVRWDAVRIRYNHGLEQTVEPIDGIWQINFDMLDQMRSKAPLHFYNQRPCVKTFNTDYIKTLKSFEPRLVKRDQNGTEYALGIRGRKRNACVSYVFDLRTFEPVDQLRILS